MGADMCVSNVAKKALPVVVIFDFVEKGSDVERCIS